MRVQWSLVKTNEFSLTLAVFAGSSTERLSITFTLNGKREFVPRDQVSSLLVVYCSLFPHLN